MLNLPCETLAGVGPKLALKLTQCGIKTLQDLLLHLPFRYQDRTRITPIQDIRANEWCVISGNLCKTEIKRGKRPMLYCYLEDKTGVVALRFFHYQPHQVKRFNEQPLLRAFGEVREFANRLEMIHPEYQIFEHPDDCSVEETLTPIYSTTHGLTQTRLRQLVKQALITCEDSLEALEWIPPTELLTLGFQTMRQALATLHNPPPDIPMNALESGTHPALKRLAFDELLAQRLSLQLIRQTRRQHHSPALPQNTPLIESFIQQLPFTLTKAQHRVHQEIAYDLS